MYTTWDFETKKALKKAVDAGDSVTVYNPSRLFECKPNGVVFIEGPHYPRPHKWYAMVILKDGCIVKGSIK